MTELSAEPVLIQRLQQGEETRLRDIRLRALSDSPEAFSTTFDEAHRWPVDRWRDQLRKLATFVAVRGQEDVGLVRGSASDDDPAVAHLLSMWVAPAARRRGVGGRLIEALLRWAEESGFTVVQLDAVESNGAAIALYEYEGFRRTDRISALPAPRQHIREVEMEVALPRRPRGG